MLNSTDLKNFKHEFKGQLILADDEGYDVARQLWNGYYNKFPIAIARCYNTKDVQTAVNFAREQKLVLAVKGGGHDYAGNSICDNGLVIDLSPMNNVEVHPPSKTVIIKGGATIGQLDEETQKHGLAIPTGTVSGIGIGGLTLGGGTGYLSRKFGLTLDSLISVEIVTADGSVQTANDTENKDLFWGIRGGGGNFGIVTSFKFRLHKVGPEVLSFQAYFPFGESQLVLENYRNFMKNAPEEIQCYAFFLNVPPVEPFPVEYYGKTTCALVACYSGDPEVGRELLELLNSLGNPILRFQQRMNYVDIQKSFDAGMPKGLRWFSRANYLMKLSDSNISTILNFTDSLPGPFTMAYLEPTDGATSRVAIPATAFPHRDKAFSFHILSGWKEQEEDEKNVTWTREFHNAMKEKAVDGVYVNLMSHDEKHRVREAYGENYERLVEVKKGWDPENLFSNNHNIEPGKS